MKKIALLGFITLICMLHTNLHAQVATLRVADTSGSPGSTNNALSVELDNTMGVGGVQFTLTFDDSLLTATSANKTMRTSNMSIGYKSGTDSIKILMYSMTLDSISSGTGPIIEILFDVDSRAVTGDSTLLHLKDAVLSDPRAQSISVVTQSGWLYFVSVGIKEKQGAGGTIQEAKLFQNYPNPFSLATEFRYALSKDSYVRLEIYNISGRKVTTLVDENQKAGYQTIRWNGQNDSGKKAASGIYFYKLQAHTGLGTEDYTETLKLIMLR